MRSLQRTIQIGSNLLSKEAAAVHGLRNSGNSRVPPPPASVQQQLLTIPVRHQTGYSYRGGSYFGSKLINEKNPDVYTKFEKSYDEWKYVEKLMPAVYVPDSPHDPNAAYPSGWTSPKLNRENCNLPYFVPRTKNHMPPVYLKVPEKFRGQQRYTMIKFVEGNLWALEKELAAHLQKMYPKKPIVSWVNESWRQVFIRGEFVDDAKAWVLDQGF